MPGEEGGEWEVWVFFGFLGTGDFSVIVMMLERGEWSASVGLGIVFFDVCSFLLLLLDSF